MKTLRILQLVLILPLILFSSLGFGAGTYTKGTVNLGTNYLGDPQMVGMFNVRFNNDVASGYVSLQLSSNDASITVAGADATGGSFVCYIPSSNTALFSKAYDVMMGGVDGLSIFASRPQGGSLCNQILVTKASYWIH